MLLMKKVLFFLFIFVSFLSNSQINFQDEAYSLGLGITCGSSFLGSGLSLVDYDNDGFDDITLATENGQDIRFFKNINGSFIEQTLNIPSFNSQTKSVTWVDTDNDGDKDLFVTSDTSGNRLYENTGNLIFIDVTATSGIATSNMFSYGASWGDIDNDGLLDVFICNRSETLPNKLYKNAGNNTFTDVSTTAGISSSGNFSFCAAFFDYNNDGLQDIYIANDKYNYANIMYRNNGNGTFTDESEYSQTGISIDAMTTTIGDFNNDGWFDIYVTNTLGGNALFKNNGDGSFSNITASSGTSYNSVGWGTVFLDAENDEDLDMYVSGSLDGSIPGLVSAAFYENLGNETFSIPTTAGFAGDNRESYSNAVGDINNDGLVDIVVNNGGDGDVFIWKNQSITTNNWIKVNLEGVLSNRDGVGSVIEISTNGNKQYRYTHCGEGYMSQNSSTESFGIGSATVVDYIKVTWLSGTIDILNNVSANQTIDVIEGTTLSVNENNFNQTHLLINPVNNYITVNSNSTILKQELYTVLGQKLITQKNASSIDVSKFPSGNYFLHIKTTVGSSTLKVIKK